MAIMRPDPDQLVDPIHQGNAVHLRLPVGIPQPLRYVVHVVQDAAGCGHADRLHLVEERVVRSILQRQQLGDEAGATLGVQACFLCNYGRLGRMIASRRSITLGTIALVGSSCRYGWSRSVPPRASFSASSSVMMWSQNAERF
jgi:hypothetical protein